MNGLLRSRQVRFLVTAVLVASMAIATVPAIVNANQSWILTKGPMTTAHGYYGAAKLQDGRVLAISGDSNGGLTPVTDVYNPASGTWSQTGAVNQPRYGFYDAVTLISGKVLIAGGTDATASTDYASAELYDPSTGNWSYTGSLNTARRNPVVVKLQDGRVLVASGANGPPDGNRFLFTSEIYDPASGQFTYTTGNLPLAREGGDSGVLLHDGRVMMLGGEGPWMTFSPEVELYNPASDTWSETGSLPHGISGTTLTVLQDGRVMLIGGDYNGSALAEVELYDPATGTWSAAAPLHYARDAADSLLLPNGKVLIAGGSDGNGNAVLRSEIYDPSANSWTDDALLQHMHVRARMIQLDSGELLMAGGYDSNGPTTVSELYTNAPTVTVQNVWTADGNNNARTSFTPGDAIHYIALLNNSNSTTVTATVTVLATGPQQIYSSSGPASIAAGMSNFIVASTIPSTAPAGVYTFTVTVTYNGVSSQGQSQFTVATVTVQKAWTTNGNNTTRTTFTPGDAIHYRAQVKNINSTTVTATFTFVATGPRQIFSWSGSQPVTSGTFTITKASTMPFDAPVGTYTLTVTVTYNGGSSQGQSQLTVTRPYNSVINNLTTDASSDQSETTIAVSSVNSPSLTVMVAYNDFASDGVTGYSYSFDGGTSWTDGGAPPVYKDSSGNGANGGDPALTVDKNGTFYLAQIEYTANYTNEFIGMSKCNYVSSTGKITCMKPVKVSDSIPTCRPSAGGVSTPNDKPGIAYDPVNNRVYITWTLLTFDTTGNCGVMSTEERLRYYNVSTGKFDIPYLLDTLPGNGTDPVVTSNGLVYVFFLQMTAQGLGQSIDYITFNNGTVATYTLDNLYPVATIQNACNNLEAFTKQAFANNHYARTNEFPSAVIDKNGNIDVVWEGATSNGGISTIFVATLPSGGGSPTIQYLPNPTHLIQWQPAIAFAGGTDTLAVTYFQVVKTTSGYQIVREQVTAPASSVPTLGAAKMISTVAWNALPTNDSSNNTPCYEGDYSASVSTPTANVVWSYWGDNRNGSQADVYGLFVNVP